MSSQELVLSAQNIEGKYIKLLWSGLLFLAIGLACCIGSFYYFYTIGEYDEDKQSLKQILPFLLCFIPVYGAQLIKKSLRERKLLSCSDIKELRFDEAGISGPIALLEGRVRDNLRELNKPSFHIPWDIIDNFIVEPVRGSKTYSSPPYYKVTRKKTDGGLYTSYFILRDYFRDREQEILDFVGTRIDQDHVIINDKP